MRQGAILASIFFLSLLLPIGITSPIEAQGSSGSPVEPICNANRNATWTVGLIYCDNRVNEDYTLFAPMTSESTYLIDAHGRMVHSWTSPSGLPPGMAVYMLEDGDLLRTTNLGTNFDHDGNGVAGKIERLSWDSEMEWEWFYPGDTNRSHHDIEPLSNGNFLMIAWDFKSESESHQAGRNPNKMSQDTLWPDKIVEVQPVGTDQANIVWEWNIWDHLIQDYDSAKDNYGVVGDHPELLDINFVDSPDVLSPYKSDWMHCNGIDYNPILDQIALSCRNVNEIYIIDHSTTTEEAAGHTGGNSEKGGDILYRWGNSEAYRAGTNDDQQLFGQHDIQWINEGRLGAGDLIVFNNGVGRSTSYSSADVISPPLVNGEYVLQSGSSWGPAAPSWSWDQGTNISASSLGGVERLENGNTLVTWGVRGTFIEVNPEGEVVWKYINPVIDTGPLNQGDDIPQNPNGKSNENKVFKTHRYNSSFPGFVGKNLTPGDYVESWTDNCSNEESIPWDSDGDGCIDDSDGDGVKDNADLCSGFDDNVDHDGDMIPDDCDSLIDTEPLELEKVCLGDHSGLAQHIHIMLVILDNGTSLTIPANTGIDTEVCPNGMHAIHTHDTSGKLHIETPDSTPVYLGTFFNIWGQPFSAEQVMHMVADANHTLTMKVDGVAYDSWDLTLLADQQVIVVEYQAASGNGTGDSPVNNTGDPPIDDTSDPTANDTSEQTYDPDDDIRLPAISLLTTVVAMAIIVLKRRRSD